MYLISHSMIQRNRAYRATYTMLPYDPALRRHTCSNSQHAKLAQVAPLLRRQFRTQQAHGPLQIHARVRLGDPLKVLLYLLRDSLQACGE